MKPRGLYAITDSALLANGRLLLYVEAALQGGAIWVQYRDKGGDADRRFAEAQALKALCCDYGAQLIINDDMELACRLAVGLHLGQEDGSPAQARAHLGPQAVLGVSCHADLALARQAREDGASYLAFGRFFDSHTKPGGPVAGPALLREAARELGLPLCAIGGITLDTVPGLIAAGADLIAVVNALFAADSPQEVERRARAFSACFTADSKG